MSDLEAEGIPPIDEQPPGIEGDSEVEGLVPPGDEPVGERVRREEPDRVRPGEAPVGRLVQPDGGMIGADHEATEVAAETEDDVALAAEEAAMHITDSP